MKSGGAWNKAMSVGVPLLDGQHQRFFELLAQLKDSGIDVKGTLDELVKYMQFHFQAEEDFMKERFFEGYPQHRVEHARFSKQVRDMLREFRAKGKLDKDKLRLFMTDWLIGHIMDCDQKYAAFIRGEKEQG